MKKAIKNILKQIPVVRDFLEKREIRLLYKTEIDLLNGNSLTVNSNVKSIIHFSMNKSATQYIKNTLRKVALENKVIPVAIHDYAFFSKIPYLSGLSQQQMEEYKHIFKPKGYLYSVFGGMVENIDNLENYKIILSIRDPRDILVSLYFSNAFSHRTPPKTSNKRSKFLKERKWAQSVDIDEFVIAKADQLYQIYNKYKTDLCTLNNVSIVKYENMVSDFDSWFENLIKISGMKISNKLRQQAIEESINKRNRKENILSPERKGVSGDYVKKLKPETVAILNNKFESILNFFEYEN